jgi:hypothetical protein
LGPCQRSDVDSSGLGGHGVGVLVDSPLVQRIDTSRGANLPRYLIEPRLRSTGKKESCPLAGES